MKALTKALRPFAVKEVDEDARTFEGIAAAYSLDMGGDVIHPGAFENTLRYWREKGTAIPLLDQHRNGSIHDVLGSMVDAKETDDGLWARFEVDDDAAGQKLLRHIKQNRINGLSIGYEPVNPERDDDGIRHLNEIKLMEVSAVLWPMNPDARPDASSVKGRLDEMTEEEKEELREALEAEAKAKAEKENPPLTTEQMDALRARLLNLRLRSLRSRMSGQNGTRNTTPTGEEP